MERPNLSENNRIIAQQRRTSKKITGGIEEDIKRLHNLSTKARLKEFTFFINLYFLGALIVFLNNGILSRITGIVLMGLALNSLPIFIHEGLHGLLAKNEKINHLITFLVGLPILVSATAYQTTHNNHHYELGRKLDYGTYRQHMKNSIFVWFAYFSQLMMGSILYITLIPILGYKSASSRSRFFIILEYFVIIIVLTILFLYLQMNIILLYLFYPLIILHFLTNIRGLASHALGDVENIYLSSRTILCSKTMSILFLNENYHLEHHLFPRVPSYNLPKINVLIWDRLPKALYSKSYIQFLSILFKSALTNDLTPQGVISPKKIKPLV